MMVELEGMPAWYRRIRILVVIAAAVVVAGVAQPAYSMGETGTAGQSSSKVHHRRSHSHQHIRRAAAPVVMYHAALLEDADTGRILYADNPNLVWPPASMAKMMLLLVASDQIAAGRVSFNTPVRISEVSAMTHGSRLGLHEGEVYPLGELMKAALIKSANDAAVAVAEAVGGSVEGAVRMMNAKAQSLGMTNTEYQTVDGLPPTPDHDVDRTSPLDLATVARALIHTTNLLQWSGMETALFDGSVVLHNTNHLIGRYEGCDGLKTGFTMQAGFNLTATARRGDMRLLSVILGAPSNPERFIQTQKLLDFGFANFAKVQLLKHGEALPVHVKVDQGPAIQPVAESDLALVLRKNEVADVKLEYSVPPMVNGPVALGAPLGQVIVHDGGIVMTQVAAISPVAVGTTQILNNVPLPPVENSGRSTIMNDAAQEKQ
jgi:D-alanyl-D-alanine carboxypeptidase (penicillin-binding protein 5/6)